MSDTDITKGVQPHKYRDPVERLHRERAEKREPEVYPDIQNDPELAQAYESLQLHWLKNYPAYREAVRQKVSEAAKKADQRARRIERDHKDVDYLGREVDGCG